MYRSALQRYLSLAPFSTIKSDENQLNKIINDIAEITHYDVIMPWGTHLTDWSYNEPFIFLSLLKNAQVFFYKELKNKLIKKIFLKEQLRQYATLSKSPLAFLKYRFFLSATKHNSFANLIVATIRHKEQIIPYIKQFFCLTFCAILSSYIGSVLLKKNREGAIKVIHDLQTM